MNFGLEKAISYQFNNFIDEDFHVVAQSTGSWGGAQAVLLVCCVRRGALLRAVGKTHRSPALAFVRRCALFGLSLGGYSCIGMSEICQTAENLRNEKISDLHF